MYDLEDNFAHAIDEDTVVWQRVEVKYWEQQRCRLVEEHRRLTSSKSAEGLLRDWERELPKFWQIVPKDLIAIDALAAPIKRAAARASAWASTGRDGGLRTRVKAARRPGPGPGPTLSRRRRLGSRLRSRALER